jgi:hypothetical protein
MNDSARHVSHSYLSCSRVFLDDETFIVLGIQEEYVTLFIADDTLNVRT